MLNVKCFLNKWVNFFAGLHYIESNFASATDKNQPSPFGFDIIFPNMLEYAKDLNINLPLKQTDLSFMLRERELGLRRYAFYLIIIRSMSFYCKENSIYLLS